MYIVILAGGAGTRLWPTSRQKSPKQLEALISDQPLLEETLNRFRPLMAKEKIWIMTNQQQIARTRKVAPGHPMIIEPAIRSTAPAIGLAATYISKKDPTAIIGFFPSDHYMKKPAEFRKTILKAEEGIKQNLAQIILVGIKPSYADTGLGYIKRGKTLANGIYQVEKFTEKPNLETAEKWIATRNYFWNGGMFVWKVETILELYRRFAPKIYQNLQKIAAKLGTSEEKERLKQFFPQMENISVDYAIIEKADNVGVIPADIGWSDIGYWSTLYDILSEKYGENVVKGVEHLNIDSHRLLIYGKGKLIATVGLENLIIVDTKDALLVCAKDRAQEVKKIVGLLKKEGRKEYL